MKKWFVIVVALSYFFPAYLGGMERADLKAEPPVLPKALPKTPKGEARDSWSLRNLAYRRLILVFDAFKVEEKKYGPVKGDAGLGLEEQASPMILPIHFLHSSLLRSEEWYLFAARGPAFVLLVPKKYCEAVLGYSDLEFTEKEEIALGLKVAHLENILLPSKNDSFDRQQIVERLEKNIVADYPIEQALNDFIVDVAVQAPENAHPYLFEVMTTGHGSEGRSVSGLSLEDFQKLLLFFNGKASFLFYLSCYGAAVFNDEMLFKAFDQVKNPLRYPLACAGIISKSVSIDIASFAQAFTLLEEHKSYDKVFKSLLPIKVTDRHSIFGTVQMRFPGTQWNTTISDLVIGEALIKARTIEKKPIVLDSKVGFAIVTTDNIAVPLVIADDFIGVIQFQKQGNIFVEEIDVSPMMNFTKHIHLETVNGIGPVFIKKIIFTDPSMKVIVESDNKDVTDYYREDGNVVLRNVVYRADVAGFYCQLKAPITTYKGEGFDAGSYVSFFSEINDIKLRNEHSAKEWQAFFAQHEPAAIDARNKKAEAKAEKRANLSLEKTDIIQIKKFAGTDEAAKRHLQERQQQIQVELEALNE